MRKKDAIHVERKMIADERIIRLSDRLLSWSEEKRLRLIQKLMDNCEHDWQRYIIVMLYIYCPRPVELLKLTPESFRIDGDELWVTLPTAKTRKSATSSMRTISLTISKTPFLPFIVGFVKSHKNLLPLTWNSPTNINNFLIKLGKKPELKSIGVLEPYVFRHFRLSYLAIVLHASVADLNNWKGGSDIESAAPYLAKVPQTAFKDLIR